MAATRLTCPACDAALRLTAVVPPGTEITCPKCDATFLPGAAGVGRAAAAVARRTSSGATPRRPPAVEDEAEA